MKVAVVFHVASLGGVVRFTHALIDGLLSADAALTIDYYVADRLLAGGRIPAFADVSRVRAIAITDPQVIDSNLDDRKGLIQWLDLKLSRYPRLHATARALYVSAWPLATRLRSGRRGKHWYEFALTPELLDALADYDIVYLPFPYYIDPALVTTPVVGTFHDVNHMHFPASFAPRLRQQMDRQFQFWTKRADAVVVSTQFIKEDLLRFYPDATDRCSIVYVPPYNVTPLSEPVRLAVLARYGVGNEGFILYPSNHAPHKNLLGLIAAADIMKRRDGALEYPVVVTGFGTDKLGSGKVPFLAEADECLSTSSLVLGQDLLALGFITDEEVDSLTRSARLVVSTSLYEAGCGPALDAWQFGVPVAFSDIPPFVEQLEALGVEAWTFDPRDHADIAQVVTQALSNRKESLAMARRSREAITSHTWRRAAEGYLRSFESAIEHHRSETASGAR